MPQHRHQSPFARLLRFHSDPSDPILRRIPSRPRHQRKPSRRRSVAAAVVALSLAVLLLLALAAFCRLKGLGRDSGVAVDDVRGYSELRPRPNRSSEHGTETGKDMKYWDRDDRRSDKEFSEEGFGEKVRIPGSESRRNGQLDGEDAKDSDGHAKIDGGLYDESNHVEFDSYKVEYDSLFDNSTEDEYNDGIDVLDEHEEAEQDDRGRKIDEFDGGGAEKGARATENRDRNSSFKGNRSSPPKKHDHVAAENVNVSENKAGSKKKAKRRKYSSSSCGIKFLNSTAQVMEPLQSKKFARFSLQYIDTEVIPNGSENWVSRFAGHQTLQEREESFYAHDQKINCGFVKGPIGSPSTGFDIADDDKKFMSSCHIAVSSCIFGNSDRLRTPFGKTISRLSRKNICFIMFMDEETLHTLLLEGQQMDTTGFMGLWKIVLVKNLPYNDMRRVGKIPKFLAHRLFPSARYSIWLDSKLRLQSDPYLILEYFLWRHGYEYAISNHYDRHCVWEEVIQNKKLNKYNHTVIDQQFEFYQADGLKKFDPSDPDKLLPSYVPEGSFIVRVHTPMSNLFSCLWFNEVDRFTPRDQLSFAYTFLKLRRMNPEKRFYLNMFKDCERRAMTKLFHHRAEEKKISTFSQLVR